MWDIYEDIGGGITVVKTKGHATDADVQAGRVTSFNKRGNDDADHYADRGARIAEHEHPTEHIVARRSTAERWYKLLAVLATQWPDDTSPSTRK